MQAEIQITNWRLSRLTFLPSRTMAEPSSPSRFRCAAPNPRRALDRSGRLCKISPLGRKVDLRKAKKQRQNQNLLDIHRDSHGRRYPSDEKLDVGYNGHANFLLNGPALHIAYYDLNRSLLLTEDWHINIESGALEGPSLKKVLDDPSLHCREA